jgi:hypothetical protein
MSSGCRADGVARHRHRPGRPLHAGERLLDRESELGVQRQRPVVHGTDPLLNAHVLGSLKLASGDGWRFAWRVGNVDAVSVGGGHFPAWRPLFRALCHISGPILRDAITVGDPVHPGPQHFDARFHTQLAVRSTSPFRLIMYVSDAASCVIEYFVGYRPVFWYSCGSFRSFVTLGLLSK